MPYLEGVYWDLDGTLANTELEAHLPAFNKSFKDLDLDWYWDEKTYIDLLKINGGRNRIAYYSDIHKVNLTNDQIVDIHKRKQFNYLNLIENGAVQLKTGVSRLINELMEKDVRQFIVTSSSRIQVNTLMDILFKSINPFEFFIASEDVDRHKPDPLPYVKAISLSGIDKRNSIVFEDSIPGVKSSLSARLPTICVKSNIPVTFTSDIDLKIIINTLGDYQNVTTFLKGSFPQQSYIDYKFLNKFLSEQFDY
tara:strand:- start:1887 stop:2642 length:756 start_codon:yes stop_codon:yes gene_type:complete